MTNTTCNRNRIAAARATLETYCRIKGIDEPADVQLLDERIIDLLADMRHFADVHEVAFDQAVRLSEIHFEAEADDGGE